MIARAALALMCTACSHGAILELTVTLPSRAISGLICENCPPIYALIDARSGESPSFDEPGETVSFLLTDEAAEQTVSIVAGEDDFEEPLELRARFCDDGMCSEEQPDLRVRFERAFYADKSTFYSLYLGYLPIMSTYLPDVGRCAIRGCTAGPAGPFCTEDGRHLCE